MEFKAVKKEQYEKLKNKTSKIGISTALLLLASKICYAGPVGYVSAEPITSARKTIFEIAIWLIFATGVITLIVSWVSFVVNRKEEHADKKLNRALAIAISMFIIVCVSRIAVVENAPGILKGDYGTLGSWIRLNEVSPSHGDEIGRYCARSVCEALVFISLSIFITVLLRNIVRKKLSIKDIIVTIFLFMLNYERRLLGIAFLGALAAMLIKSIIKKKNTYDSEILILLFVLTHNAYLIYELSICN